MIELRHVGILFILPAKSHIDVCYGQHWVISNEAVENSRNILNAIFGHNQKNYSVITHIIKPNFAAKSEFYHICLSQYVYAPLTFDIHIYLVSEYQHACFLSADVGKSTKTVQFNSKTLIIPQGAILLWSFELSSLPVGNLPFSLQTMKNIYNQSHFC